MSMIDPRDAIPEAEREHHLSQALAFADTCREVIAAVIRSGFEVSAKLDESLVTTADIEAERAFRAAVEVAYPQAGILGEEFGISRPDAALRWVIDPIDGTAEFARRLPFYGTIIGLFQGEAPLAGVIDHPALGIRCHAARGLGFFWNGERMVLEDLSPSVPAAQIRLGLPSRIGFERRGSDGDVFEALTRAFPNVRTFHTCIAHAAAAAGSLDATVEWDVPLWDVGATRILVEEAGGRYLCLRERAHPQHGTLYTAVFGRPRVVEAVAAVVREALASRG
jgi:histidinol-phosphatase